MRRIEIIGRLGKDAELKALGSGDAVCNFRVATNGRKKEDEALWFGCALFGKRAETLVEYLKQGKEVFIRGELKLRKWESNGKSGTDLDVSVDEIELLGGKSKDESAPPF